MHALSSCVTTKIGKPKTKLTDDINSKMRTSNYHLNKIENGESQSYKNLNTYSTEIYSNYVKKCSS